MLILSIINIVIILVLSCFDFQTFALTLSLNYFLKVRHYITKVETPYIRGGNKLPFLGESTSPQFFIIIDDCGDLWYHFYAPKPSQHNSPPPMILIGVRVKITYF